MVTNYFSTLSTQTINSAFGTPDDIYNQVKGTSLSEAQNFFSIGISFVALFFFIRAFSR